MKNLEHNDHFGKDICLEIQPKLGVSLSNIPNAGLGLFAL
jgi:hypothetical protein